MLLSSLFGSAAGGSSGGYPFLFPNLFGSGQNGIVNFANVASAGYMGAFGAPQFTNATLPAGVTLTVAPGSSSGGLIMACNGTFTIAGSIVANGGNGGTATTAISGAGGGTAGGGAGGSGTAAAGAGNPGQAPIRIGHGCLPNTSRGASGGGAAAATATLTPAVSMSLDTTFGPSRLIDPVTGLRFSPPQSSAVFLTQSNTASTWGTQNRALTTMQPLTPAASALSFDLLPTGMPGMQGSNIGQDFMLCGGGGGGGGLIYIEANTIVFQAGHSLSANGGNGGSGNSTAGLATANTMGGMGGDGGLIVLVASSFIGTPNASVSGGTAGAPTTGNNPNAPASLSSLAGRFLMIQV